MLAEACAGDDRLRQELESPLRYEPELSGFLGIPLASSSDTAAGAETATDWVGRRLGPDR